MASRTAPRSPSKPRSASGSRPAPTKKQTAAKAARRVPGTALPGWTDLGGSSISKAGSASRATAGAKQATKKAAQKARSLRPLDAVPSLRFGLLTLLGFLVVTLFVSHVYATQAVLTNLQEARRENERLRLNQQRLQGDFDQMTGPDAILHRAARLGLEEGIAYGSTITLDTSL
jgi:hypothetical protein